MKLRIKGNSLRVRVSRSEVARLLAGDCLEETIHFTPEASAKFTYALRQETVVESADRSIRGEQVVILMPADQANAWGVTDQVGIAENISLGNSGHSGS
jgi:ribosome biogenesis protein Nip4